jgi:hypothetical protein
MVVFRRKRWYGESMLSSRLLHRSVLVVLAALAVVVNPAAAAGYTPLPSSDIVAKFSAFRVENGFSAVIEQADLSAGCRLHTRYMSLNKMMEHHEFEGTNGYSEAGNAAAGESVLASGPTWRTANPWLNAPLHLTAMLRPEMTVTGANEEFGYSCLNTNAQTEVTPDTAPFDTWYSYPRDGGPMPFAQTVFEAPTPPQTLGANPIKDGVATGPNLVAIYRGPQMDRVRPVLSGATLTGPNGATVPVKVVNRDDSDLIYSGTGIIIPRVKLQAGATYTWSVTFTAPAMDEFPAFSYSPPARTFRATSQQLCGNGDGGWYKAGSCPVRVLRVSTVRRVRLRTLNRPLRIPVVLDGPGRVYAVASIGRSTLAYRAQTIGARERGTVVLPVTRGGRVRLASLLKRRRSVVMLINVSSGVNNRTVRVVVTR